MTFKEKYQAGEIEFEAIDDYVDEWNNSDDERTLAKFLGLNADEEDAWIDDGDEALKEMLPAAIGHKCVKRLRAGSRKKGEPL